MDVPAISVHSVVLKPLLVEEVCVVLFVCLFVCFLGGGM